jgi:hypothetical protein
MAWRPLLASVINWSVWGFMVLLVLSQFLGIGWNATEPNEHFLFGRSPDNPPTLILGMNDEPYTDRCLVCMPHGRSYIPMQVSEVLANPRYSQVVDTAGASISGFRMSRREQISLEARTVVHYQHVCEHIDQTLDAIHESCERLGYNITREELRIVGDITSDTTHAIPRALPIAIIPFWDNALSMHYVIPGWDGMACDFRLEGTFRLPTEKSAVLRGVPRSVREWKTVQWLGKPGGEWRNGWYEDGTGQRWSTHMLTTDSANAYGLKAMEFDLLRNVEIDCEVQKSLRECIQFVSVESWGKQCSSVAIVKRINQVFISNGTHFGLFMYDAVQRRTITTTYSLETLISNVSTLQLLFRWWVSMMIMANSYRRGVAPWQSAGIGILSCSRTFNLLPVILLPRLKMIMASFWTIGCQFEGQQRAMSDAWFTMYPAMCELLLLYYSLLNFITKVLYRRMSDAWFGPTLLALALMHRFRKALANPTWLGVDGRVATVVSSDEFDSLGVIDMLTPSIAFRLNGNIALVFYAKIILLALNLVPLVLSENMTKSGRTYRLCEACRIEQTLALRASNIGGLGRSSVYVMHGILVQSSPRRPRGSIQPANDSIGTAVVPFKSNGTAGEERTPLAVTAGPSLDTAKGTYVLIGYEVNRLGYLIFGERFLISFDDWFILTSLSPLRVIDKLWNHRATVFDVTKTGDGRFIVERKPRICRLDDRALLAVAWYDVVVCALP